MAIDFKADSDKLFELVWNLWDKGESRGEQTKKFYEYWNGQLNELQLGVFTDQKKSTDNIVKQIVEAKLRNVMDAQFTLNVVPVYNSFADLSQLKEMQNIADIYNDELHNVLHENDFDDKEVRIARWGLICGHGAAQVMFDDRDRVEGQIVLEDISPEKLRWNTGAKKTSDLNFVAYQSELNPYIVKKKYAVKNGVWDVELCKKIDDLTEGQGSVTKGQQKGVVNIQSTYSPTSPSVSTGTADAGDMAYAYDSKGINAGQICKLIVMFLLDDTVYAPETKDTPEQAAEKKTYQAKYPNGRMIVFSENKEKKLILEDKPAPEGFKGLGNIDIFNPVDFIDLFGKGEVEDLMGVQDRINGMWLKIRQCVANYINTIGLDEGLDIEIGMNDLVANPVTFLRGIGRDAAKVPQNITNNLLDDVEKLLAIIDSLHQKAYSMAGVNEMMLNGIQPKGVTSADQLESLQESPMSTIRAVQRAFGCFMTHIGEKIITLIQENYNIQRIIRLSTGIDVEGQKAKMARFTPEEKGVRVDLLTEAGQTAKSIKLNKNWKFRVDVVAGTDIPRTRKENANIMDDLVEKGVFNLQDLDHVETIMREKDIPNYRAIMQMLRQKQKEMAEAPPVMPRMEDILSDKDKSAAFKSIMDALQGHDLAAQQLLKAMKLIPDPNTLENVPIEEVTSRSDIKDIMTTSPDKISKLPEVASIQNEAATKLQVLHKM